MGTAVLPFAWIDMGQEANEMKFEISIFLGVMAGVTQFMIVDSLPRMSFPLATSDTVCSSSSVHLAYSNCLF